MMPNFALIRFSPISDVLSPRRVSRNSAFSWLTFSIAKCAHSSDYFNFCSMIMWRSVMICVCSLFWIYYIYICKLIIIFISFLLSLTLIWLIYFRLNDYSSEFHKVICAFAAHLPGHLGIYFVLHIVSCLGVCIHRDTLSLLELNKTYRFG